MPLIHCQFHSEVLMQACAMDVILPQATTAKQIGLKGISRGGKRGHPTLYLLHGMSDDHTIWQRRTSIERYVAGLGLAVVMPAVHRSYYTDMKHGGQYWTFISEELPALAQQFFHLSPKREDTFAAGLSMGGYGAMKLGLRCPDKFAAVASLSGALNVARFVRNYKPDPRVNEYVNIFGKPKEFASEENDLLVLASKLAKSDRPMPKLYACCGTEDFLYQDNQVFREHAAKLGLELTYEESPGTHEWGYWDKMIQQVLAWLPLKK